MMKDRRRPRHGIKEERAGGARLQTINLIVIIAVLAVTAVLLYGVNQMLGNYHELKETTDTHLICQKAAQDMIDASDYLTEQARFFAVTGEREFLDNYFEEIEMTQRRDKALARLEGYMPESDALELLEGALKDSNALEEREVYSMRLMVEGKGYDPEGFPKRVRDQQLEAGDQALSAGQKMALAETMVFDEIYQTEKSKITASVEACLEQLLTGSQKDQDASFAKMERTMHMVIILIFLMLALFITLVILVVGLILRPLYNNIDCINKKTHLPMKGAYEMQYMASVYNKMFDENLEHQDRLAYDAVHDSLTGAYNRAGFEEHFQAVDKSQVALILLDIDYFKEINDTHGHSTGDLILRRVAALIRDQFRAEDHICRIGGDEFAIIMVYADSSMTGLIRRKIRTINDRLQNPETGLPAASLSVGVAIGDRKDPTEEMFKDADTALYAVKRAGRNGCAFYGEEGVTAKAGQSGQS